MKLGGFFGGGQRDRVGGGRDCLGGALRNAGSPPGGALDQVSADHVVGAPTRDDWPTVARAVVCTSGAVALGWHEPTVAKWALGVIALIASPSLARTVVAPWIASILKKTSA